MAPSASTSGRLADRYRGRRVALLTQHGKERLIGPVLAAATGCRVLRTDGFDTDLLGTFTRDIPRQGSQIEAARRKARIGMRLAGLGLGLASEGAFGADPYTGLASWDIELVLFVDAGEDLEVVGMAQGTARNLGRVVCSRAELRDIAAAAGFPEHRLVVRPDDEHGTPLRKGIADAGELERAYADALAASRDGAVFVETDLRAHCNPTRQAMIRRAAHDLAAKLQSACPACHSPGYWTTGLVPGLPCRQCGTPTGEPLARILGCVRCDYRDTHEIGGVGTADPGRCQICNP